MSPSAAAATAAANKAKEESRLRQHLETGSIQFKISTGGQKYVCNIVDRATHERRKASRTGSADSIQTTDSESSSLNSK